MSKPDRKPASDFEPDYDEAAQLDYSADFADPDAQEASQEWCARKQK